MTNMMYRMATFLIVALVIATPTGTLAQTTRGVVEYHVETSDGVKMIASAVIISKQWAITLDHVAGGNEIRYLKLDNDALVKVTRTYWPRPSLRRGVDDVPVLLKLAVPVGADQLIATIGNASDEVIIVGMSRLEVKEILQKKRPDVTMNAESNLDMVVYEDADRYQLHFEPHNRLPDAVCTGDSGGGVFNDTGEIFALVAGVSGEQDVSYAVENDQDTIIYCVSSIINATDLRPYTSWINRYLSR